MIMRSRRRRSRKDLIVQLKGAIAAGLKWGCDENTCFEIAVSLPPPPLRESQMERKF
jgi:hypothetical protein